jgi:hypothetical protein
MDGKNKKIKPKIGLFHGLVKVKPYGFRLKNLHP